MYNENEENIYKDELEDMDENNEGRRKYPIGYIIFGT